MHVVEKEKDFYGIYLPDDDNSYRGGVKFKKTSGMSKYIPIWNEVKLSLGSDIVLTDGANKYEEVSTYNRHSTTKFLLDSKVKENRIDVTHNDLMIGPVKFLFNFTLKDISLKDENGLVKTFSPIVNNKMEEFYGKVVIFEITPINLPQTVRQRTGVENYLLSMSNLYHKSGNKKLIKTAKMYDFISEHYREELENNPNDPKANSIKVVSMIALEGLDIETLSREDIYLSEWDLVLSYKNISEMSDNPKASLGGLDPSEMNLVIKENSIVTYINDPDNELSDRYISVIGKVIKVPVIKSPHKAKGFYIVMPEEGDSHGHVYTLDGIKDSKYIHKSKEEALTGADLNELYKKENDRLKSELDREKIESERERSILQIEHDKTLLKLREDLERIKQETALEQHELNLERARTDSELNVNKNESEALKEVMKAINEGNKQRWEEKGHARKDVYEAKKYERDNSLETLKTMAGIAAVVTTGILLYRKLT